MKSVQEFSSPSFFFYLRSACSLCMAMTCTFGTTDLLVAIYTNVHLSSDLIPITSFGDISELVATTPVCPSLNQCERDPHVRQDAEVRIRVNSLDCRLLNCGRVDPRLRGSIVTARLPLEVGFTWLAFLFVNKAIGVCRTNC